MKAGPGRMVRPATLADLPSLTEIHNHYIRTTHITFDAEPFTPDQRVGWFHDHSDGRRYRLLVAEAEGTTGILGYAASGRFRSKQAYETTVEVSVACHPDAMGMGIGSELYRALFALLTGQDVHRVVAGIAQPNSASNALHQKFGFRAIGTFSQVGRKFGKYWDVLWMERSL